MDGSYIDRRSPTEITGLPHPTPNEILSEIAVELNRMERTTGDYLPLWARGAIERAVSRANAHHHGEVV